MSNEDNDNARMEDSLDNMSNIKLRQSSLEKHRIELIQVKQKFIGLLEKLQTSQTREISLSEIKKLIERNRESDHLRIYLSILKSLKPNHNSTTKQHQVLVISIIAKAFKSNLIDPVQKQPTLLKTCFRVVEILLGFFNDSSNTVQHACARVLLDLNEFCLQQDKFQKQQKISILFAPLLCTSSLLSKAILKNGVDKASQSTATVCINELIKFWYLKSQKQYLDLISRQVFCIILKINSQYQEIFMAAIILIDHKGLGFFENNKLPNFLSKILPIIDGTRQGVNSFNAYMCKVNVCKIIEKVAILLKPEERQKLGDLNIVGSLAKCARNKIIQVQMAATRALKVWKGDPVSQQKIIQYKSPSKGKPPLRSLEEMRDQKKRQRSNSKQNTIKIQNELNYMKEDLQKMVKGGWGANNRAKNYVKRGSGVGGGHYGQFDSSGTPPKSSKSHKEHLQELRSMIKQGVKENKNTNKFDLIQQHNKVNQERQTPTSSNNNVNLFISRNNITSNNNNNQQDNSRSQNHKGSGRNNKGNEKIPQPLSNNDDEFMQANDDGDQAVYIPQKKDPQQQLIRQQSNKSQLQQSTKTSPHYYSLSQQQSNNLKLNFNYTNHNKQQKHQEHKQRNHQQNQKQQQKQIKRQMKCKDPKFISKQQKLKQNLALLGGSMISSEQLQELMLQNNLSEVSENISNLINQSDLNMGGEDIVVGGESSQLQQPQVKQNNFMKKTTNQNRNANDNINPVNYQNTYNSSLNYTQSRVTNSYKSTLNNNNSPKKQQFTLNPNNGQFEQSITANNNKFTSLKQNHQHDQEIEQDIVESYFQESKDKQHNLLPVNAKISPKSGFSSKKDNNTNKSIIQKQQHEQEQSVSNYQQLIQNPPTSYQTQKHFDKKSFINNPNQQLSQQTNNDPTQYDPQHYTEQPQQQQNKQTITDKWIRILTLVQNNDINSAFQQAFQMDDPIYLIRLLIITRTPISSLTAHNCGELWEKFLEIYRHNFISILFVQLFTQASDLQLIKNSLTIEEMHDLLLKLYQVSGTSKGKLSFNAALLYNKVDQSVRPGKK